ncbi:MAG TPA: ATP-binding protein, partial [Myxococcaceae bacterium]|nr:ATP-binding protein [Myxococcaceae bacterium]
DGEAEDLPGRVFRSGAPLLFAAVRPDPRLAADPAVSGFRERVGASSLLLVPLRARDRVVGVLAVVRGEESPPYGAEDEVALQQLADLAALALENARLYAEARAARKRTEALAEEASKDRQWLEAVLDWLPTPLFLVEQGAHRVLYANRAADVLAGGVFPRGEDEESFCRQFACADSDGKPLSREQLPSVRASRGEEVRGYQMTWTLPSGTRSLLVNARLLRAGLGHPATAMVCLEDVTSLKRAQAELEEAIRVRDTFLSIAGHELKTPLTTLQLQIQSLGRMAMSGRPMDVDKSVQKIEAAHRQTERLAVLIGQLLDVSRINAGRLRLDLQPLDLAALVRDVTERFTDEGERVGSELQVSAQGRWVGRWDRERLDQVLSNLLSNALKYGRGKPVEVWLEGDEHHARLHVRDHGIGIAPEDQARIFDRFERAVSDRHYGGLGLGLWIVREVVAALGGTIRVESTPGEGSLFTVELPVPVQR